MCMVNNFTTVFNQPSCMGKKQFVKIVICQKIKLAYAWEGVNNPSKKRFVKKKWSKIVICQKQWVIFKLWQIFF